MYAVAISYLRYSSDPQGEGDSIRRQLAGTQAWCERHGVPLDQNLSGADRGRSAFRGKHRKAGGVLARFMADVESGRVPPGACLILENLDRLSRENPWDAVPLLCSIVNAGVAVVTLSPSEVVYQRGRDLSTLLLAVVEFGRSHSESASKSDRLKEAWGEKQRLARQDGETVTKRLPAWVEVRDGERCLIPHRAAMVRRMFDMATKGYGLSRIVKALTEEKVATWGRGVSWSKAYVHKILSDRVALGEYQPKKGGKPAGEPIAGYYPAVVDEQTWDAVHYALVARQGRQGRLGEKVTSLFTGMVYDALTGGKMLVSMQCNRAKPVRTYIRRLVQAESMEGARGQLSYPYHVFEAAILSCLKEIKPSDVLGDEPTTESTALAEELGKVALRRKQFESEAVNGDGDGQALAKVIVLLAAKEEDLTRRLKLARHREANPKAAAWDEMRTLLDVATEERERLRLRDLIRTNVERMTMLVVPIRSHRLAVVQLDFTGGRRRSYIIDYQSAGYKRAGGWSVRSFSLADSTGEFDLRDKEQAARLASRLSDQ